MASRFAQGDRPLRIKSPLGDDVLLLEHFSGVEEVSQPFRFTLHLLSDNHAIDPAAILRKPVAVTITLPGGGERLVHGRVSRFAHVGRRETLTAYRAEMVPWLWFLSLWSGCRIFHEMTVLDIAEKIFKESGFSDFKMKVMKPPPKREYCVQYRETNLAFVSRLLEEEGIFYFFEHSASSHVLTVTDHSSVVAPCPGESALRLSPGGVGGPMNRAVVTAMEIESASITGKVTLTDYNFETPSRALLHSEPGKQEGEIYDYPGGYGAKPDGERYARLRLEQLESRQLVVRGQTNSPSCTSGHRFDLTEHPTKGANQAYHLLRVEHDARMESYLSAGGATFSYENRFEAIPHSVQYRPPLATERPIVHGSQTAVVVGKGGEEIWVDKLGRVKVQFHWDREGKKNEKSSCWVRVSSTWAGKHWGFIQIPRMGQEVIVDFLEGDPDHPIITGRVYNGEQMPPYELPANQTQSGVKSRSSKGGGTENFNEIRFEDKKGSEELYIHAERNRTIIVEHDERQSVGNDRTEKVGHDEHITIENNRTESVGADESISIGNNRTKSVGNDENVSVESNRSVSVGADDSLSVTGAHSVSVSGDESFDVSGEQSVAVGKKQSVRVGDKRSTEIGKDDELNVTKKLTVIVGDQIQFTTGDASITMKKDGTITIKGKDITLNGSGKINVKASSDVVIKGSKISAN